ncbi:MAG TPA: DcaP family trimeric outer membrane transporter [Verrucomicrobiae bacterium]
MKTPRTPGRKTTHLSTILPAALLLAGGVTAGAQTPAEVDELKAKMRLMEQSMQEMKQRISELESNTAAQALKGAITNTTEEAGSNRVKFWPALTEFLGRPSLVEDRNLLNDHQEGAPRPNDLTLDPQYRGFVPVPNTGVLIKFNAKPRLDAMVDDKNSGNSDRFVTATIPTKNSSEHGGGMQFDMNAKGSQLSFDVRAPEMPGDFRFYYQNDFFGSGNMGYRLKQLYGQFFNFTAGFTFSIFEDPDVWPDTVDYEGPNSAIFARQATARYLLPLNENWQLNFGIQEPSSDIDGGIGIHSDSVANNQAPDGGMNVRWEHAKYGHVQLAGILRALGSRTPDLDDEQNALGWGLNLSAGLKVFERDSVQAQVTYGEGIFHFANDNFSNNDAAFDDSGELTALPYLGLMAGYTHRWNDDFRSTLSMGYINVDNEPSQGPDAYHETYYGSLNVIWQLRKRLSVGLEFLYGKKEVQSGDTGDVFRTQVGMVYSLFD